MAREDEMPVDPRLLELLVCPACKADLTLVTLPEATCDMLVTRFRDKFRDETPEVREGLQCSRCRHTFPIVSDIPVMLLDESLPPQQ